MERVLLLIAVLATVSSIVISNEQANASEICYGGSSISWTGNGGDDLWSNTQNWNPQRLPASNDVICIHGGPFTVHLDTGIPGQQFILDSAKGGLIDLGSGSTLTVDNGVTLTHLGSENNDKTILVYGSLVNNGIIINEEFADIIIYGSLTNNGIIQNDGNLIILGDYINGELGTLIEDGIVDGNLNIPPGMTFVVNGDLIVSGNVNVPEGGTLVVNGNLTVEGDVINQSSDTVTVFGTLTILGALFNGPGHTVIVTPSGIVITPDVFNEGIIIIDGVLDAGFVVNWFGGDINVNSGGIFKAASGILNGFISSATLTISGTLEGFSLSNDLGGVVNLGCETILTLTMMDNMGLITSPIEITVPLMPGSNPVVIEGTCSTGGGSGDYHTGPTFGKDDLGTQQVQNGFKLFKGPELVQQFTLEQFHTEALIEAEPNTSYTFVLEAYSPLGADAIDEVKIFTAPRTFNQNEKIWEIRIIHDLSQPNGYRLDVTDPQDKLTDPITFTVQNAGSHKIVTITVGGFEITGDAEAIGLWARDTLGYTTISWVNDGLKIADIFSYPALLTGFEGLLSTPKVCTEQEDPDNRYSCAFAEKKNAELAKAQQVYNEITKNLAQAQVEKYAILDTEYKTTEIESKLVYGPQLQDKMHLITIE